MKEYVKVGTLKVGETFIDPDGDEAVIIPLAQRASRIGEEYPMCAFYNTLDETVVAQPLPVSTTVRRLI